MANPGSPLAERMRPQLLADLLGQEHLVGDGAVLRKAIEQGRVPSMILWGPPGSGKTTLAHVIAMTLEVPFYNLSAISSGVKEVREVISLAEKRAGTILFIDEIHRFNKGQQDALLGAVEKGLITLIGATTENPSFEVNSALLSRCQVYVLRSLEEDQLLQLLHKALQTDPWLMERQPTLRETHALLQLAGGDARKLLNLLELVVEAIDDSPVKGKNKKETLVITDEKVMKIAQQRVALYDKKGEQHYDIISAFIKSIRGSDPNGAVYWLARMIEGGEDVKFIARRMVILASEDIGNANPTALVLATSAFQAVNMIGYPEARIVLSQCATYLASSPKSNASYKAIGRTLAAVKKTGALPVPLHLRNAPTGLMKKLDYGKDYQYAHDYDENFSEQEYLPDQLRDTAFYEPGKNTREEEIRKFLRARWKDKYGY